MLYLEHGCLVSNEQTHGYLQRHGWGLAVASERSSTTYQGLSFHPEDSDQGRSRKVMMKAGLQTVLSFNYPFFSPPRNFNYKEDE